MRSFIYSFFPLLNRPMHSLILTRITLHDELWFPRKRASVAIYLSRWRDWRELKLDHVCSRGEEGAGVASRGYHLCRCH